MPSIHLRRTIGNDSVRQFFGQNELDQCDKLDPSCFFFHPPTKSHYRRKSRIASLLGLLTFCAFFLTAFAQYDRGGPQHRITWGRGSPHTSAVFGDTETNVTAVVGHKARLPCQVKNLGRKSVSWIRQRDLHILTVDKFTYTTDDRFKVFHPVDSEHWSLDIASVTFRDGGVYECQVSTSPKVFLPVNLFVIGIQQAQISGPREVYIRVGSTISLTCEVPASYKIIGRVQWIHGTQALNYSSPRGGISMELEKTPSYTISKLFITRATKADTGNYTCGPEFANSDSVMVHVVNEGEESAAAVHSGASNVVHIAGVVWSYSLLPSLILLCFTDILLTTSLENINR